MAATEVATPSERPGWLSQKCAILTPHIVRYHAALGRERMSFVRQLFIDRPGPIPPATA
nr:hypothetical protein GCM10020063_100150 [Dactylosporangium thailandense]